MRRVGDPDPARLTRFHRTGEGDAGARDQRRHLSLHTRVQELPMRSAPDVTLLGIWVPDSASPSSPPPQPPSAGPEGPRTSDSGSLTGSDWGGGNEASTFGRPDVHLHPLCLGQCQAGGGGNARRSWRGVSPSMGAVGEGPCHPQPNAFPALRSCEVTRRPASRRSWRERWRRPAERTAGTGSLG